VQLIAYYRVSTERQGQSGLGIEAQQAKVQQMAAERGATVVAEFTEVESGRKADRPQLAAALAEARRLGAAVAVAKLDRIARDAELVLRLSREAAANGMAGFLFADLPDVDATTAAGRMVLTVMASVAEFEARRISERTREALAAAKARGVKLGGLRANTRTRNDAGPRPGPGRHRAAAARTRRDGRPGGQPAPDERCPGRGRHHHQGRQPLEPLHREAGLGAAGAAVSQLFPGERNCYLGSKDAHGGLGSCCLYP
jgi:DNA invertase Pin-like site-specific DNA recombinase